MMQNTSSIVLGSSNTPADSDMLYPPQLPLRDEVDKDVALKYLETYQVYTSTYLHLHGISDERRRASVSSNQSSIAPSASASQTNLTVPAIVRVDSRDSCVSYTPPNLPSEYSGLIVGDRSDGSGFCYLALIKDEHKDNIKERLGRYPTFQSILELDRALFIPSERLCRMQVSCVAPGHYHVLTGTIMPNVMSTLAVIARRAPDLIEDANSMYRWVLNVAVREGLSERAPQLNDILGSGNSPIPRRIIARAPQSSLYARSPMYHEEEYRTRYDNPYRGSIYNRDTFDPLRGRPSVITPRQDRSYHYINRDSMYPHSYYSTRGDWSTRRSRETSDTYDTYGRTPSHGYDTYGTGRSAYSSMSDDTVAELEYQRALRESIAEYERRRPEIIDTTYDYSDMQREIDDTFRNVTPPPRINTGQGGTTRSSYVSSNASSTSTRVAVSLEGVKCSICQDHIAEGGGFLQCGHVFHSACVDPWLLQSGTCPECRARQ